MNSRIAPPPALYHYTTRAALRGIIADGAIRPHEARVYRDAAGAHGGGKYRSLGEVVWLTINPNVEGTTLVRSYGREMGRAVGDYCRIVLPGTYCDVGLAEHFDAIKLPLRWGEWLVRSGEMVGSNYTTWRLHTRPIPVTDWLRVEVLTEIAPRAVWSLTHPVMWPDRGTNASPTE